MKRGFLVYNPSAGRLRKTESQLTRIVREFTDRGIEMTPSPTAPNYTVVAQVGGLLERSPDLLVVWGGDGTINEVVNGMRGSRIPLGVLSGGTANLFVREMSLPQRIIPAIRVIAGGKTRTISLGRANSRYFVLMVGVGFDSQVIKNVDLRLKKRTGIFAFAVAAVNTARNYSFPIFSVQMDGQRKDCIFAVIANGREYAALFQLAPAANVGDEFFYVCLFKEPGFRSMLWYAFHAFRSTHHKLRSVEIFKATSLEITGDEKIPVQADGEIIGFLPMKFEIVPNSLQVFVP